MINLPSFLVLGKMGCDPCRRAKALGEVRADVKYMQMDDQGIEKLKQQGFDTMPVVYMQTSPTEFKYIGGYREMIMKVLQHEEP